MKCPFRTITAIDRLSTREGKVQAERYADCYDDECMAYRRGLDPFTREVVGRCERMKGEYK